MKHRLDELFDTIREKKSANPKISYTAKLLKSGTGTIAQKVGEEAVETIIEAVSGRQKQFWFMCMCFVGTLENKREGGVRG